MNSIEDFMKKGIEKRYTEKYITSDLSGLDLNQLGILLCSNTLYEDFIMYENNDEISIGIGKEISLLVNFNEILIHMDNENITIPIEDFNNDLDDVFKSIPLHDWRAYGIANFGLAYYNYKVKNTTEPSKLMEIFIPKIDIRLYKNKVYIRALQKDDILRVENIIEKYHFYDLSSTKRVNDNTKLKAQDSQNYKYIVSEAVKDIGSEKYEKVILSRKIFLEKKIDMAKSYVVGRKNNNPARSYYIKLKDFEVIGYSPETVIEVDKDKNVYTFPLAGTRAMGENHFETEKLKKELKTDLKEIAEHAVSVKLAYEELEKVCENGTVSVIQFMDVLERGTVQHLASRLKGKIKDGMNEWHAFNALFPAVTASGIPKKESIEAICRMEKEPRELYSGSVLTYDENGSLDAALVLRSAYQDSQSSWLRAGAGIVKLSNSDRELEETKEKLSCVADQLVYLES